MRFLRKLLLWIIGIVVLLIALAYVTGNEHLIRGVRHTYLIGRAGPEIDDRPFFPSIAIPATDPQPWPQGARYGRLALEADQEKQLTDLFTSSFLLIQDDSLVFEQYWNGWTADSTSNSFSVAKSYIGVLVGIAMQEGRIDNVFQRVGEFLPEFDAEDSCHRDITLYNLLTMSTGLDWSESGADPFSDNAKGYYGHHVRDLALSQPCRQDPGVAFDYISGSTQIMVDVLEKIYGEPLDLLVEKKVWGPLGAEHLAWWGMDREDGDFKGFCCLYATPRDFARIGQLYLDSGMWRGKRIVPKEYWQASITPAQLDDKGSPNKRYGYYWWLAEVDGRPIWYCRGFHGQYVVVIPHERLVMVRTGMKREEVNATGHPTDVFKWIGIALDLARRPGTPVNS